MCGDNSIKAPEMRTKVKEMNVKNPETDKTVFESQFDVSVGFDLSCDCHVIYNVDTNDR